MTATRAVHCLEEWAAFVQTLDTNTQPKVNKKPPFDFSPFNCCFATSKRGPYPKHLHIGYCGIK